MSKQNEAISGRGAIFLPTNARTRDGCPFNPKENFWVVSSPALERRFDFTVIQSSVSPVFLDELKATVLWFLENRSLWHAHNISSQTIQFIKWLAEERKETISQLTSSDILNYRASLKNETAWYLGSARVLLLKLSALGYASVDKGAIAVLMELIIPGNSKGVAVLTHDINTGPFSDVELDGVIKGVTSGFEKGILSHSEYSLFWLFCLLGVRPVQIALLKVKDFKVLEKGGESETFLFVPSAKKRGEMHRESSMPRSLTKEVSRMIERQIALVVHELKGTNVTAGEFPIFPSSESNSHSDHVGFYFHSTSLEIRSCLTGLFRKINVISERTGEQIHITATRFRRTVATRAAVRGYNEFVIAELLDHADTQNARVYIEARPEMVDRIDAAIAHELAALSNAFQGIVMDPTDRIVCNLPDENAIADVRFDKTSKPFASCTQLGQCGFDAPVACYVCPSFRPWVEGPHEIVLEYLIEQRDIHLMAGRKEVAKVNDRTIIAVAEVIRKCTEMRDQSA